ncbi:hypothetical protein HDU98_004988, partial [Podochytrium sp. JEL0797]
MAVSPDANRVIRTIMETLCPIAIAANAALIISVYRNKIFRKTVNYFQACLAGSEIMTALMWTIGPGVSGQQNLCTVLGVAEQFFINGTSCWCFLIPLYSYVVILYSAELADQCWPYFHTYGWGVPSLLTALVFILSAMSNNGLAMGDSTYTCWISANYPGLRVSLFFIPMWIHFVLIITIYTRIYFKIHETEEQLPSQMTVFRSSNTLKPIPKLHQRLLWKSGWISATFIVSWVPATVSRGLGLAGSVPPDWLKILVG